MEKTNSDFDFVMNLTLIEKLKCILLSSTSNLFCGMTAPEITNAERKEYLTEIIISAYLLSNKLGISFEEINKSVINKLKIDILGESMLNNDQSLLLKHLNKEQ